MHTAHSIDPIDRPHRPLNSLRQLACIRVLACAFRACQNSPMTRTDILCIGSLLWDIIGRSADTVALGSDVPGRIVRLPGGVAMNIAMTLRRFGLHPAILTAIGRDDEGHALIRACERLGIGTKHVYQSQDLPTDRYMAVEGANGLIAAIADAHSLEAAGDKILRPLADGTLGTHDAPFAGLIALDGNLTAALLGDIATSSLFAAADLRVAPASPGKVERLLPLIGHPKATLYVNLEEARQLCGRDCTDSAIAAQALIDQGAQRVLVTDGGAMATLATPDAKLSAQPPKVPVSRVTGAGDTFMAAHIAAEISGDKPEQALNAALQAAADYVSGDT